MNEFKKISSRLFIFGILLITYTTSFPQSNYRHIFQYLSPKPEAEFILPEQKISFRLLNHHDPKELSKIDVRLQGSVSGCKIASITMAEDSKTVICTPKKHFELDEKVIVTIHFPAILQLPDYTYSFRTTQLSGDQRIDLMEKSNQTSYNFNKPESIFIEKNQQSLFLTNDSLPENFPEISIIKWNNPIDGYFFISPLDYDNHAHFLIILDNYGTPVYFRNVPHNGATDFKLQPNGFLTSFIRGKKKYIVQNSFYEVVDTIGGQNGYVADMHELRYYEEGHAFLLCCDPQIVDMSQIVPGGNEQATVIGLIVQELDQNKNVVFQWRSWDYYQITDASDWIDLTENSIDYVHGNSIEVVSQNELMISARNMNEITKIDRNTGDIIWRLNGENNMFEFIPEEETFCVQHSIRLMPDSINISLFDNGNCWDPSYSSALEYALDEDSLTCTLINRFRNDPDIFGSFMGNTQRLLNGSTVNGWGAGVPSITEFDENGNIEVELSFPLLNYRAFKYDWTHEVFSTDVDQINFDTIYYPDTTSAKFIIYNHYSSEININRIVNNEEEIFKVMNQLPILIQQNDSAEIFVQFIPDSTMDYKDVLTLCWEILNDSLQQRIAVQVRLQGSASVNEVKEYSQRVFKVYPNPAKSKISIEHFSNGSKQGQIINMLGKQMWEGNIFQNITLDVSAWHEGIYILKSENQSARFVIAR